MSWTSGNPVILSPEATLDTASDTRPGPPSRPLTLYVNYTSLLQAQETIQAALASLPEEAALDTKLTIKTEPMDTDPRPGTSQSNADGIEPALKRVKREAGSSSPSTVSEDVDPLDEMMCDIVDAM